MDGISGDRPIYELEASRSLIKKGLCVEADCFKLKPSKIVMEVCRWGEHFVQGSD